MSLCQYCVLVAAPVSASVHACMRVHVHVGLRICLRAQCVWVCFLVQLHVRGHLCACIGNYARWLRAQRRAIERKRAQTCLRACLDSSHAKM